jgi:hypothetical protein
VNTAKVFGAAYIAENSDQAFYRQKGFRKDNQIEPLGRVWWRIWIKPLEPAFDKVVDCSIKDV